MSRKKEREGRQKPLSEADYMERRKPKGAFASVWVPEDESEYSSHKYKIADLVAVRLLKEARGD